MFSEKTIQLNRIYRLDSTIRYNYFSLRINEFYNQLILSQKIELSCQLIFFIFYLFLKWTYQSWHKIFFFSQIKCKKASETGISILNEIIFTFHFTEHVTTKSKVRRKLSQLGLPNWIIGNSDFKLSEFDRQLRSDSDSNDEIVSKITISI